MRMKKTLLLVLAALLTVSRPTHAQNNAAAGNAESGKRAWLKYGCYSCHGYDGHGGNGVKLAPKPIAMAAFMAYVRHPSPSGMPVFTANVMPDGDLRDVWAYLNSIPQAPAAKDIPLLQ
jgi:cytochrome c553